MSAGTSAVIENVPLPDVQAFEAGAIDPVRFNHEAHVHVAWCYLQQYPLAEAIARFTAALRSLTVTLEIAGKYHETISWFFMIEIADRCTGRRSADAGSDWETFRRSNADLFEDAAGLLHRHYSRSCLASAKARRRFVLPDLAPVRK